MRSIHDSIIPDQLFGPSSKTVARRAARIAFAAILVLLAGLWHSAAVAQAWEIDQLHRKGMGFYTAGKYQEAIPFLEKARALAENEFGPEHPRVAAVIQSLALLFRSQGHYGEAEPLYRRALAIREKILGPEHRAVAESLSGFGWLRHLQGRYDEAEMLHKRALAIREKVLGPEHRDVARTLNNLAELYRVQGRYGEAEPLYRSALAIREKVLGPEHPNVSESLHTVAILYQNLGRYEEAESFYRRALTIREKAHGLEHPRVATVLQALALLFRNQGRYSEAEPLYLRSLAIREKVLGPEHRDVAQSLSGFAWLRHLQGRHDEAEPLLYRSLTIREKALGPEHRDVAISLNNLAEVYRAQGRSGEAELVNKRALAIREKALGPEHPDVSDSLNILAALFRAQGRHADAEPLYRRALAIREKVLGPEHPRVAVSLNYMALLYQTQGRYDQALGAIRRASAIYGARAAREGATVSEAALSERKNVRFIFLRHAEIALASAPAELGRRAAAIAEAFEAGQLANATGTAAAVARMGARFGSGDDVLARLAREWQDLGQEWVRLDKALVESAGRPADKRDADAEARSRERLTEVGQSLSALEARLAKEFPAYAELASPKPVTLAEAQTLLAADEAMIVFAVWDKATFLWVVRKDRAEAHRIGIGEKELSEAVMALRRGLDFTGARTLSDVPPFDMTQAHGLYKKLLAPAEPLLEGVRQVFVVPDGALQSLPLGVLVTKEQQDPITGFAGYRQAPWLAKRFALATLPSVSSLRALRHFVRETHARKAFIGIGDPLLDGSPGRDRQVALVSLFASRGIADVRAVKMMAALPETADELKALARVLGAGEESLFLGKMATESRVKSSDLSARVLAFATHGLVAGDLKGLAEPALVLTPPFQATDADDGLLTASEVAQLKLDADWVILSACNTASSDGTPGAEGLSGLAKAFFYAGSRSLLVSHWPTETESAKRLTTGAFKALAADPALGRAGALRASMLALMDDPQFAHPLFWAPFVLVGEGAAGR